MILIRPTLFATAATVRVIERARAVVALIGSYDGSGNFGDIAQFGAASDLIDRLGAGIVALPVLEREYLGSYRKLSEDSGMTAPLAIFFDPSEAFEDDLMPIAAPIELTFGACYLYGGGYLNRLWGERKLAMLEAAEALITAGGAAEICRLSSGLQVEPEWLASGGASALFRFDLLGARDDGSRRALAKLGSGTSPIETGDDAIGLLQSLRASELPTTDDGRLRLNLHFAEHHWVSKRSQAVLDFYAGFVAELGRLTNRPIVVQPLIAYLDERVDESTAVGRLKDACCALDVEVDEPLVLRPASLAAVAPRLSEARLALSCSYHVALASLMLEVPTVLIADNPYYAQKAAGLREDFGLPAAFAPAASADPLESAREIASAALDKETGAALRSRLGAGASRLRRRRAAREAELVARLGSAALIALGDHLEELAERLRQRSDEPAELHAQLAALHSELEELRLASGPSAAIKAELRAQEAERRGAAAKEALTTVLQSRSWRMAAPLRRLRGLLRRR